MAKKPEVISATKVPRITKAPKTKSASAPMGSTGSGYATPQPARAKAMKPAKQPAVKEMNRFPKPRKSSRHTYEGEKY